jgi:hypothetical protein
MRCVGLCLAPLWFVLLACGAPPAQRSGGTAAFDIEGRLIHEDACPSCEQVEFDNAYTSRTRLLVERGPDLEIPASSIHEVRIISLKDETRGVEYWKAAVYLGTAARDRVAAFRRSVGPRQLLLVSLDDQPMDVLMAGELTDGFWMGHFDSEEAARRALRSEAIAVEAERIRSDPEFEELVDRLESAAASDEAEAARLRELAEALIEGDEVKADRLSKELGITGADRPGTEQ